jgi:hypothetical protein
MFSRRLVTSATLLGFFCACAHLAGQVRGYHKELSDGTSGYVILANDSSKTIEAFRYKATCARNGRLGGSTSADYDMLSTPSKFVGSARGHDGRPVGPPQPDVIAPGGRMQSLINFPAQPGGCPWQADIDAVIYSDGTYEGSNDGVRSLQVWRDGLAGELQYWSTKLHQDSPAPFDPHAISSEAQRRADSYVGRPEGLMNDYESAKRQVTLSLAMSAAGNLAPDELQRREVDLIDRWKKKLDDDIAFKKMNEVFPLPAEVISSAPKAAGTTQP